MANRWGNKDNLCSNEQTLSSEPIHAREIAAKKEKRVVRFRSGLR